MPSVINMVYIGACNARDALMRLIARTSRCGGARGEVPLFFARFAAPSLPAGELLSRYGFLRLVTDGGRAFY